jgi:hypothetical protein
MGQVFLGRSRGGRPVAVKGVRPGLAADRDYQPTVRRRGQGGTESGRVPYDIPITVRLTGAERTRREREVRQTLGYFAGTRYDPNL